MTCPVCKGERLALEICMDDGFEWEEYFCLDCQHQWPENYRRVFWEAEEE